MKLEYIQDDRTLNKAVLLREAGVYLSIAKNLITKDGVQFLAYNISPFTVNCAFACELYFKYLRNIYVPRNGKKSGWRTHKLSTLYGQLPLDIKQEIQDEYYKWTSEQSLEMCLETHSNAFETFRYMYEQLSAVVEPQSLYNLCVSLHNVCINHTTEQQ